MARLISKKAYCIHINAGNDRNGNPRRGWLCYSKDGEFFGFVVEGYSGFGALQAVFSGPIVELVTNIPVQPAYYADARRLAIYHG